MNEDPTEKLIKDLKVKGSSTVLKQGTVIKSIRLTDIPEEIDCRHETVKGLVLRTEFVRKRCAAPPGGPGPAGSARLDPRTGSRGGAGQGRAVRERPSWTRAGAPASRRRSRF